MATLSKKNQTEEIKYVAPLNGYYIVLHEIVEYQPTGEYELTDNLNKKWWQFWKPSQVRTQVMKRNLVDSSSQIVRFKQGDNIFVTKISRLHGGDAVYA